MIIDNLRNYKFYNFLQEDIFIGLEFLSKMDKNIDLGVYEINERAKAIITEYETKEFFELGYEAHQNVIDIQYPLVGRERILWSHIDDLKLTHEYNPVKDVSYYGKTSLDVNQVDIGNGVFAIMFPSDAHSPQKFIVEPQVIKKATIKVKY
ncbi:YhcH/YjgK/YiaL family protein [Aquimarina aquimarini]|uniref:YhcH/YjgK/YiaL family protein n=1 Tax=Aquimarina aquimarini TaxID=1191734 RepID=UPI000D550325|nr:YhcH/YjgK/YiaL family protein [Aquimarina aquimarini]